MELYASRYIYNMYKIKHKILIDKTHIVCYNKYIINQREIKEMKVKVQKNNKVTVATGSVKGRRVKAVVVCHPLDEFNEEKGIQLATQKYKIKEKEVKRNIHESNIKQLKAFIKWAENEIIQEEHIVSEMNESIKKLKSTYVDFCNK